MKTDIGIPSQLSDDDLVAAVNSLARCEREATAGLLAHLAELDARRLYLAAGFSSLFTYCCTVLHLSEPAAYNRIEAARTARRFPAVLPMLGEGALSLATVRLLSAHLTAENHQELLAAAAGKSKREVEELLVRHFPRPEVPPLVRKLPGPRSLAEPSAPMPLPLAEAPAGAVLRPPIPARRAVLRPLTPDRYEIRFTASAQTRDKLRQAQDLLRHSIPSGDLAEVIDRALSLLLKDLARKKFAATERPRASRGTALGSRDIAAKVRRTVGARDNGRCAFVSKSGRRCNERAFIEFDHIHPHGAGGEGTTENIRLLCRAHNAYKSVVFCGHGCQAEGATLPGTSSAPPP